jgi:hypothetical protein
MSRTSEAFLEEQQQTNEFPSTEEILLKFPLYEEIVLTDINWEAAQDFKDFHEVIDAHCVQCGQHSTFRAIQPSIARGKGSMLQNHLFSIALECTRNLQHEIFFHFRVLDKKLIKIGQHPSAANFQFPEIGKYRQILGQEKFKEFSRGVGLVSHGVGIGAFVYLRRIFEDLIEAAHQEAKSSDGWDEEKYGKSRMDEKITLLKSRLPDFLSENASLYSILSKGIHALSEEECLRYFDAVKMGIEMILDEKLEQEMRRKKAEVARKALSSIHSVLK